MLRITSHSSMIQCTIEEFIADNCDSPDLCNDVARMGVGDVLKEGGGAAEFFIIRRLS